MKLFLMNHFDRQAGLTWALSLSICFTTGWLIGYSFALDPIEGSGLGGLVGLTLGGFVGGLLSSLKSKMPHFNLIRIIITSVGWALAFFLIEFLPMILFNAWD